MKKYPLCEATIDGKEYVYTLIIYDNWFDFEDVTLCNEDSFERIDTPVKLWSYYDEKFKESYDVDQYGNKYSRLTEYSPTNNLVL